MGSPADVRRSANVGMKLQCARPRTIGSAWTIASGRVLVRIQRSASCCAGLTLSVQGNPGAMRRLPMSAAFCVSMIVVGAPRISIAVASTEASTRTRLANRRANRRARGRVSIASMICPARNPTQERSDSTTK